MKDEIKISENKFCPPHYLPHKIPLGKKIENENCHIHKNKIHMLHHKPFCKLIKCQHYEFMIKKYKESKNENNL